MSRTSKSSWTTEGAVVLSRLVIACVLGFTSWVALASGADELLERLARKLQTAQSMPSGRAMFVSQDDLGALVGTKRKEVVAGLGAPSNCPDLSSNCAELSSFEYPFFPKGRNGQVLQISFDAKGKVVSASWGFRK